MKGEMVESFPRHCIPINLADAHAPDPHADPNTTQLPIAYGEGFIRHRMWLAVIFRTLSDSGFVAQMIRSCATQPFPVCV